MQLPEINIETFIDTFLIETDALASSFLKERPTYEGTSWTKAVKKTLAKLGLSLGYDSLYSDREADLHEFMLDFVWWDKRSGSAVLACECELGNWRDEKRNPARVAEDFDKLLSFKAPIKLMLFDSYGSKAKIKTTTEDVLKELNRYLADYGIHLAGETYLLIDLAPTNNVWKCEISKNGRDPSLEFIKLK